MAEIITPKQFTRRDLLRLASIGIVGAAVAPAKSASSGTRGLLAARGMAMAKRGGRPSYDVTDYVGFSNGDLLSIYDGIRNVSANLDHDNSSDRWYDLIGNAVNFKLATGYEWGDDYLRVVQGASGREAIPNTFYRSVFDGSVGCTIEQINVFNDTDSNKPAFGISGSGFDKIQFLYTSNKWILSSSLVDWKNYPYLRVEDCLGTLHTYSVATSSGGIVDMYIDGVNRNHVETGGSTIVGQNYYMLNGEPWGTGINTRIKCIRVYKRKLSDEEVAANYAVDCARFNLT